MKMTAYHLLTTMLGFATFLCTNHVARAADEIQTVFLIAMENHNWTQPAEVDAEIHPVKDCADAPYLNKTLIPMGAHAEAYHNVAVGLHPSEPNYIWLEAGTNFGIKDDQPPAVNHIKSTDHLTVLLDKAGVSWRSYQEDIPGDKVPLTSILPNHPAPFTAADPAYNPKHNAFVFFDDAIGVDAQHPTGNPDFAYGIAHNRPLTELAADLQANKTARYNFITPNLFHDTHDAYGGKNLPALIGDSQQIKQGDDFLAKWVPAIMASDAYKKNGAIFIFWEETEGPKNQPRDTDDFTLPMIVISPLVTSPGYSNHIAYSHSSTLRTLELIFHVQPFLGAAKNAADLSDLFAPGAMPSAESEPRP